MPVKAKGTQGGARKKTQISLREAVEWYFAENYERLELDRERTRLAAEQADKVAIENAESRGDLARISVIAKEFADAIAGAQSLLLAIPTKEAPMLAPMTNANAIESRLRNAITEALQQLANYGTRGTGQRSSSRRNGDGTVRAAAATNGKRVGRGKQTPQ